MSEKHRLLPRALFFLGAGGRLPAVQRLKANLMGCGWSDVRPVLFVTRRALTSYGEDAVRDLFRAEPGDEVVVVEASYHHGGSAPRLRRPSIVPVG